MDSSGLVILPTHRVVFGLGSFELGDFVRRVREYFRVEDLTGRADLHVEAPSTGRADLPQATVIPSEVEGPAVSALNLDAAIALLRSAGRDETALLALTSNATFLLRGKPGINSPLLAGLSERQQGLDVVKLHKLILEGTLGMSEEDIRAQKHIKYVRDPHDAVKLLQQGANIAFLMNPVHIEQMRDVAFAGEVMPQKSTDFYPKLLSGLTIYSLQLAAQDAAAAQTAETSIAGGH
jgi:hypothetical protein